MGGQGKSTIFISIGQGIAYRHRVETLRPFVNLNFGKMKYRDCSEKGKN
jgi:hypothetical protein